MLHSKCNNVISNQPMRNNVTKWEQPMRNNVTKWEQPIGNNVTKWEQPMRNNVTKWEISTGNALSLHCWRPTFEMAVSHLVVQVVFLRWLHAVSSHANVNIRAMRKIFESCFFVIVKYGLLKSLMV